MIKNWRLFGLRFLHKNTILKGLHERFSVFMQVIILVICIIFK